MQYVDGFVLPIPKKNLAVYRRIAKAVGKVFREHGALDYREWVANDNPKTMPFDGKRMIFGGFKTFVEV